MNHVLQDRVALIVGGGSGIGRGVVDAFRAAGARTAVLDNNKEKCASLMAELNDVPVICGDATTREANEEAIRSVKMAFGGLDILVHCVGIFDFCHGIADLDADVIDDAFDEMFAVNVKSQLHAVKAALPVLQARGGAIILTESTSAYYPGRGGVLYVASKFAVRGVVAALAHELAPRVRVNGVAPGGTLDTDLRGLGSLQQRARRLADDPGRRADLVNRAPLRVAMTPRDHAGCYVFLASDYALGITGDVIHSDGGVGVRA